LAAVPHRQVVLALPKRLRAYFLHDRRRLGLLSRFAARALRRYVKVAVGERGAVPGLIVCVQTFGAVAHGHPHQSKEARVSPGLSRERRLPCLAVLASLPGVGPLPPVLDRSRGATSQAVCQRGSSGKSLSVRGGDSPPSCAMHEQPARSAAACTARAP
jgi:hypothetical protein